MAKKKNKEEKKKRGRPKKQEEVKEEVVVKEKKPLSKAGAIAWLIVFVALFIFALCRSGEYGIIANNIMSLLFGHFYFIVLLTLLFFLVKLLFYKKEEPFPIRVYVGVILLNVSVMMLSSLIAESEKTISFSIMNDIFSELGHIASASADFRGGIIGTLSYVTSYLLFGEVGSIVTLVVLFIISLVLIVPLSYFKKVLKASREVVINTANSLEESAERKEEARRLEAEKQKALEMQRMIESMNENPEPDNTLINAVEEAIKESEEEKQENSEFVNSYFIADDNNPNVQDIKTDDVDIITDNKAENPSASTHIQTKLEDAAEPKLEAEPRVLKKTSNFNNYKLPNSLDLLNKVGVNKSNKNEASAEYRQNELIKILANFGIKAIPQGYHIGPSVTKFEIKPDATVNLSKINSLSDNIKMGLSAKSIRIEAPIPGKNAVGVEVPNAENTPVRMAELINSVSKSKENAKLLFALGKDLSGSPVFCDLSKMPHLLIAGATGSGKSVCINAIITSYLLRTKPDEVKLILVDPKKVEFTPYHDIPHLLWPVITDSKMASMMLKKMVKMMEDRYELFAKAAVRDINAYNEKVEANNRTKRNEEEKMSKLPYIVVIIDELADLMQTARNEVESSITRITQLARASGIHLIVATQRPSTDVITGLIKSNIPSRISFAVSSAIDSRTILDSAGAEELLGNGDMLYSPQGENVPKRLQGCWVTDEEIEHITNFVKAQAHPDYDDTYFALQNNSTSSGSNAVSGEEDDLYDEAREFIAKTKKASTSSLQRRFGIGYNRAARLIDTFEENGLIGPANGSKPREVYIRSKDEHD